MHVRLPNRTISTTLAARLLLWTVTMESADILSGKGQLSDVAYKIHCDDYDNYRYVGEIR